MLKRGSSGDDVAKLQGDLTTCGCDPGRADGVYGAKTEQAVRDFQAERDLDADGIAGPATLGALAGRIAEIAMSGGGSAEGEADAPTPM